MIICPCTETYGRCEFRFIQQSVCLSTDKYEYRRFARFVPAPRYTVDVDDGVIIPGRAANGISRFHRLVRPSPTAADFVSVVFKGLDHPAKYRYLSFNPMTEQTAKSAYRRWSDNHSLGCNISVLGTVGEINFDSLSLSVSNVTISLEDCGWARPDLSDLMFGPGRATYIGECRSVVSSIINVVVMHGFYTDKQPEIYGSEEADLI